jgi:DNA-binding transcriptional regulator YhcF (GntR family)
LKINFDPSTPIYSQIIDGFKREICSGALKPGEKVLPVRELAMELGVNPNTLQRAMSELEREGLLYTERTSGRYVTQDSQLIFNVRKELSAGLAADFLKKMTALGCSADEIIELIKTNKTNGENENE